MNNYAYITLITNNSYMPGLVVLLESFKNVHSQYPMYVVALPDLSDENRDIIENYYHAIILDEQQLIPAGAYNEYGYLDANGAGSYHTCMAKLHIFKYTNFDKLIYVDADMVFLHNIDGMFEAPHLSAVIDPTFLGNSNRFNAGFLIIKPNQDEYDKLINIMNSMDCSQHAIDDQQILYRAYPDWPNQTELHLPDTFNYIIAVHKLASYDHLFNFGNVNILHMTGAEKPWRVNDLNYYKFMHGEMYCAFNLQYINMINYCYQDLLNNGFASKDIKNISIQIKL